MEIRAIEQIADALLYEGYILYPYRASAVKNRKRFNFGLLHPPARAGAEGGPDAARMQTECVVLGSESALLDVKVRFLQLVSRTVRARSSTVPPSRGMESLEFEPVERLEVSGNLYEPWDEAVEREIEIAGCKLGQPGSKHHVFSFLPKDEIEQVRDSDGLIAGVINRKRHLLQGLVQVSAKRVEDGAFKLVVSVSNQTKPCASITDTEGDLRLSLISTHTILRVCDGEFISVLDPPDALRSVAASCRNIGTWPVLIGEQGKRNTMLSSPIILYDYPQVAPESPGDFFDGTEIDEMLALRIMTLTDDEKREMRHIDRRARAMLERTESLPREQLMKLHGTLRSLHLPQEVEE